MNYAFQLRPLLAECLGTLRFVPDPRVFEFTLNLDQPFRLALVVKDTPLTQRRVR